MFPVFRISSLIGMEERIRTRYRTVITIFLVYLSNCSSEKQNITINLMVPKVHGYFSYGLILPGIEIGRQFVEENQYLPNHNLIVNYSDTKCSITYAPVRAFEFMNKGGHAIFGPVCDYSLAPVARYAPFWHMPVITPGGLANDFKNKTEYKTLTTVGPNFHSMVDFIFTILQVFKWTKLHLLYDPQGQRVLFEQMCYLAGSAIIKSINDRKRTFSGDFTIARANDEARYGDILKEKVGQKFSVVILCASADSVREIMIKAHELHFDNGEYVFLNIDLFSSKDESEKPWERLNDTEERNQKAKKAYEALMTVTLRKPISNDYQLFSDEVKRRARENDKNFTYGEEEVNSFVGAFHDAVILYALALNESLSQNMSITNGTEITRRMWNRTFTGITGTVSIDDNGDRNADYSLLDMDPISGKFKVVANYYGNNKEYKPVDKIHWAGGRTAPPPDTPKCGFDGSKCPPSEPFPEYGIVIIVLGSLLVIFLIAAFFIYRRIKLEAELAEMNWRVKWEDIMFGSVEHEKKLKRQGSTVSLQRTNGEAFAEGRVLIERGDTVDQTWCKCGSCEDSDRQRRLCCRQLELFGIFQEGGTCITSSRNFKEVVTNKEVLTSVFIHVMLVRRQRGAAPMNLSPCKFRLMAIRQFLCWMHRGQKLKKESRMTVPSCVSRAIRLTFPDETGPENSYGRETCTTTCLAEIMPLDT